MRSLAAALAAVLLLSACAAGPGPAPTGDAPATVPELPSVRPVPTIGEGELPLATIEPEVAGVLEAVISDAADRMDRRRQDFVVLRAEQGTWPDASLGCPYPGIDYDQSHTAGYWIVLTVAGIEVDYRVGPDGALEPCTIPARMRQGPAT